MRRIRCAIYTRKSSEDGLEQDFNSLDAQREACEAYIASQRHEGWELLSDHYDDGGISGGHLDRPALQHLMEEVDARQVDQIVVYKIDRLTRSLADFAKLVERLEERDASFVSVIQSFNTSTSMGRLTLNVLLSFAQFEREVTAERIRDKIAASKRKGLWMGGNVPLGYEPDGRTLKINEEEAATILQIYELYEGHQSVKAVRSEAERAGLRSKLRQTSNGAHRGGQIMSTGQLHHILTNPIYAGRIRHKGKVFEGQHEAIIDPERWEQIQTILFAKASKARMSKQHRESSPLAGKLFDEAGEKLTPSHTKRGESRYRYYISKKLVTGVSSADEKQRTWRIPAAQLEEPIADAVRARIIKLKDRLHDQVLGEAETEKLEQSTALSLVERAHLGDAEIVVHLDEQSLMELLNCNDELEPDALDVTIPFTKRRRSSEMKLVVAGTSTGIDQALLQNIANANHWYACLKQGASFDELAKETGTSKRRIQQMIHLAFLAPDIVRDVTKGSQALGLTSNWLLRHELPAEWKAQHERIVAL